MAQAMRAGYRRIRAAAVSSFGSLVELPAGPPVGPPVATPVLLLVVLAAALALPPAVARAAFERDVLPSSAEAVCRAGPPAHLIDILEGLVGAGPAGDAPASPQDRAESAPGLQAGWTLRFTSSELYALPELRGSAVSVARRSPGGRLALDASSFGSVLYREETLQFSVARRWSQDAVVELRGRALCLAWDGGDSEWSAALDAAVVWLVRGRLVVGLSVRNATRSSVLTSPVASGVSGDVALVLNGVTVLGSLSGEPGFEPSPAVGCELALASWFRLRCGMRANPSTAALGIRLGSGRALRPDMDLAWMWHPVLGSSYSLTVSIRI